MYLIPLLYFSNHMHIPLFLSIFIQFSITQFKNCFIFITSSMKMRWMILKFFSPYFNCIFTRDIPRFYLRITLPPCNIPNIVYIIFRFRIIISDYNRKLVSLILRMNKRNYSSFVFNSLRKTIYFIKVISIGFIKFIFYL